MTYLAVGEQKADALDTDLQQTAVTRAQVLYGELSSELRTCIRTRKNTVTYMYMYTHLESTNECYMYK